jgi:hypothetical protein
MRNQSFHGIFPLHPASLNMTMRFQNFVIAFDSATCYESACCGCVSTRLHRLAKHYGQVGKRRAMPTLLRHEKIGGHH